MTLGVHWAAPVFERTGYGEEARNLVAALLGQGVRMSLTPLSPTSHGSDPADLPAAWCDRLQSLVGRRLKQPFVHVVHISRPRFDRDVSAQARIWRTTYEVDGLPRDWVETANEMDQVWVPGRFIAELFGRAGVDAHRLRIVPQPIDTRLYRGCSEIEPLRVLDGFVFLSVFRCARRKGWDVLLRAFTEEFRADEGVTLALKVDAFGVGRQQEHQQALRAFADEVASCTPHAPPAIRFIDSNIHARDMPSLYAMADAYVMPSRGEGWGRPYMEAMAMGLPTIGTAWGGNLEFMSHENSYLIDYDLVEVGEAASCEWPGYRGFRWAEPSLAHLRKVMRRVFEDAADRRQKAARAQDCIHALYSQESVGRLLMLRLHELAHSAIRS